MWTRFRVRICGLSWGSWSDGLDWVAGSPQKGVATWNPSMQPYLEIGFLQM